MKIILPLPEELLTQELERLTKEKGKLIIALEKLRGQLTNEDFVSRAPAPLIEKHQQQLARGEKELEQISEKLESLQKRS